MTTEAPGTLWAMTGDGLWWYCDVHDLWHPND